MNSKNNNNHKRRRDIKHLNRRLVWAKWRTNRNRNMVKRKKRDTEFKGLDNLDLVQEKLKNVKVPEYFSFIENPEIVIAFLNKLQGLLRARKKVYIDLHRVRNIDYGSIVALLSVMFDFKSKGVRFNGNFPAKLSIKRLLINSGFLQYLGKDNKQQIEYTLGKKNQMFTQAKKMVEPQLGLPIMKEASKTIWGEYRLCPGLQRILVELMQNTNNHADLMAKGRERWWLSVNHDPATKTVSFVFVDYGIGIFESLKNKPVASALHGWLETMKDRWAHGSNAEMLRLLLSGDRHLTVTGERFRGKGLPSILKVLSRNQISNLRIITNEVYGDISNDKYRLLNNSFRGTFYFWQLNNENSNSAWTISE